MKEWQVELIGHAFDLEVLAERFISPGLTVFNDDDGVHYLKSTEFNSLSDSTEVQAVAKKLLESINGAMMVYSDGFQKVQIGSAIVENSNDGKRRHQVIAVQSATMGIKASSVQVKVSGAPENTEKQPHPEEFLFALATNDQAVAKALHFFAKKDWDGLFKTYETVRENVGNEHRMIENGWTTRSQCNCFRQTAQSPEVIGDDARHATQKNQPPSNPMSLPEARSFIRDLLKKWASWKLTP